MPIRGDSLALYTSREKPLSGRSLDFEQARYVVLGFPYDRTSTYRRGSAMAPTAIREASGNIETFSFRSNVDVEEIAICDVGDLDVVDDLAETLRRLEASVRDVHGAGKIPILIGGEHTLTYGAVRGLGGDVAVVDFDAHLDLRDQYMGSRLSHTTHMRRLAEEIGPERIVEVGTRAVSKGELEYARDTGVHFYSTLEIRRHGAEKISTLIAQRLSKFRKRYITIDMDVLDPAYAPGVGNPEGDGLEIGALIDILTMLAGAGLAGLDLVEVCPGYDTGITAAQAVKVIFEALAAAEGRGVEADMA
ncbi:agmatinase [Candidatus Bathyarchaeota archaeon]|nr:agmatinase [Candidatus Bathyarchaeota archaeon]